MDDSRKQPTAAQPPAPVGPINQRFPTLLQLGFELGLDPHLLRMALLRACEALDGRDAYLAELERNRQAWTQLGPHL